MGVQHKNLQSSNKTNYAICKWNMDEYKKRRNENTSMVKKNPKENFWREKDGRSVGEKIKHWDIWTIQWAHNINLMVSTE